MASAALAFDRVAPTYDATFGVNPVGRLFRYVFQERLLRVFPRGARLLDLGCGTGEDALFLASRGRRVVGVDISSAMVEEARAKAVLRGVEPEAVRFLTSSLEQLAPLGSGFDGAYSDFGALNCADLQGAGRALARALRPGAPLVLSLIGARPLPLLLQRLFTGNGEPRGGRDPRVGGIAVPTHYPSRNRLKRAFGAEFAWTSGFALGATLPGPEHAGWATRHPQAFALLAVVESVVRHWPILRGLGDHNVTLGRRR